MQLYIFGRKRISKTDLKTILMKKNIFYTTSLILSVLLFSCNSKKKDIENALEGIPVIVQKIEKSNFQKVISLSGNIEGNKTINLGFLVAGKINFLAVDEGSVVTKGMLLSSLDVASYQLGEQIASANLSEAQDQYNRLKIMYDRQSLTESDFIKITNTLKEAKAQQKLQAKNVSDSKLYSPINGVVLKKRSETDQIVSSGMPVLILSEIDKVKINASIPETELHDIKIGQKADIYIPSLDSTFTGKINLIGSVADATTRAFSVKVNLNNPKMILRPGMIAEMRIFSPSYEISIVIPTEAVMQDLNNQPYVYVVDPKTNKAFRRNITIGSLQKNQIQIISGLNENELLVTGGQQKISDGTLIVITD